MKILIVEDELASRKFLTHVMSGYGECDAKISEAMIELGFLKKK